MNTKVLFSATLLFASVAVAVLASLLLWQPPASAETELMEITERMIDPNVQIWGYVSAMLATAIGALGAAYAVATVASASVGALTEKPELFGRVVILVGLAEGVAIYGLIVSVLILNKL